MKRLIVLAILCFAVVASASPFITASPQTDATKYRMRLSADNGVTWSAWTEGASVSNALKFDLSVIPKGNYLGEAQAGGEYEVTDPTSGTVSTVTDWSVSAPFALKVRPGQKTTSIRVIE